MMMEGLASSPPPPPIYTTERDTALAPATATLPTTTSTSPSHNHAIAAQRTTIGTTQKSATRSSTSTSSSSSSSDADHNPYQRNSAYREKPSFKDQVVYHIKYFIAKSERPPILYIRQILWILLSGWILFLYYLFAAIGMIVSIVFIPFAWPTLKLAIFSFLPIQKELFTPTAEEVDQRRRRGAGLGFLHNPKHPFTILANIFWLIFFGWQFFLIHLFLGLVQLVTIIGIGNALINFKLAILALWPFGRDIRPKPPTPFPQRPLTASEKERQRQMQPGMVGAELRNPQYSFVTEEGVSNGAPHRRVMTSEEV